jgi:hypothetical protein
VPVVSRANRRVNCEQQGPSNEKGLTLPGESLTKMGSSANASDLIPSMSYETRSRCQEIDYRGARRQQEKDTAASDGFGLLKSEGHAAAWKPV